jgi:hypothetical protein
MNKDAVKNLLLKDIKQNGITLGMYFTILDTTCIRILVSPVHSCPCRLFDFKHLAARAQYNLLRIKVSI